MAGVPSRPANSASSLASGSLQAQPAPGDSEVSRGAWICSAVTVATVAGAGYQMAVAMCRSHGIGVYLSPRRMPAVIPLRAPLTTRTLPLALEYMTCSYW